MGADTHRLAGPVAGAAGGRDDDRCLAAGHKPHAVTHAQPAPAADHDEFGLLLAGDAAKLLGRITAMEVRPARLGS